MGPSDEAGLELIRQLRVAAQLHHVWINQSRPHEGNLHPAAAMLLSDLAVHGECRPSELAKRKMVDVSVVSRQIAQLTAAGLVDRRPAPEDGRAALVRVSESGKAELQRLQRAHLDFFREALSDWKETEVSALTGAITAMNEALRQYLDRQTRS